MQTSRKTDFRKLKITLVTMTYHSQHPHCPSLFPHVLLKPQYEICSVPLHYFKSLLKKILFQNIKFPSNLINAYNVLLHYS